MCKGFSCLPFLKINYDCICSWYAIIVLGAGAVSTREREREKFRTIRSGSSYIGYVIYMYVVYSYVHKCNLFFLSACLPLGIKFVSLARPHWGTRIYTPFVFNGLFFEILVDHEKGRVNL